MELQGSYIPKVIHYCWFGTKKLPELELACIDSWKKYLPDYELRFWNEQTFDIEQVPFTSQAYRAQKYAFVSDYVRAYALSKYGGIYLDTDVEVLSDFTSLLEGKTVVLGFENRKFIGTAFMAFSQGHSIVRSLQDYYDKRNFQMRNGHLNITANPLILAEILTKYNVKFNGQEQCQNDIYLLNREYFFPKKIKDGVFLVTNQTVAIHHFTGSWLTESQRKRGTSFLWKEVFRPFLRNSRYVLKLIVGKKFTERLEIIIRNIRVLR